MLNAKDMGRVFYFLPIALARFVNSFLNLLSRNLLERAGYEAAKRLVVGTDLFFCFLIFTGFPFSFS